ncbi:MAG: hypothetical protein HY332_08290 [Chloroflexi bacterium]|nr:hypothetical protein [Chloroflexota bacterium]
MSPIRPVLVLTSDTGAGHRSVSNALIEGARERDDVGLALTDCDPFGQAAQDGSSAPPSTGSMIDRIVSLYGPVIVRAPWLWGWGFRLANNPLALQAYLATFGPVEVERIARAIKARGAQAIVSVHPLVNHAMVRARAHLRRPELPLMTVVTDLVDVHRWWASPGVDQFVVGSDVAAQRLYEFGIAPKRVAVLGIPLRREFWMVNRSAREMRQHLALDPDRLTVLLMGGGEGAGGIVLIARSVAAVAASGEDCQLVVVAGRNWRARSELGAHRWPVPVRILGSIDNVAEYMTASDVVVTKPGSLTIAEATATGRPLLLGRPLPGQEEGNVAYVVNAGAGLAYRTPTEAAEAVRYLIREPEIRWEMSQRAARLSRPLATERTLDLLQGMILRAEAMGHFGA